MPIEQYRSLERMRKGEVDECLSAPQYRFKEREGMKLVDGACSRPSAYRSRFGSGIQRGEVYSTIPIRSYGGRGVVNVHQLPKRTGPSVLTNAPYSGRSNRAR